MVEPVKNPNAPSTSQKVRALEKQLAQIQNFLGSLVQDVNTTLNQQVGPVLGRLADLEEIVQVLVENLGAEEVNAAITEKRAKKLDADIAQAKSNIADGVAKGFLVPAEVVSDKSLIVGFESSADHVPVSPAWASLLFAQIREDLKPTFLGVKVGSEVPNGTGFFNITEIYEVDQEKAREVAEAASKPAEAPQLREVTPEEAGETGVTPVTPEPPAAA